MALWALYPAQGSTIFNTNIKSTTIKRYIKAASSVTLNHKQLCLLLDTRSLEEQCIKDVLSEVKRWESMPNHREPVTVKIVMRMHKKYKNDHPDTLESIPCNCDVLGIFYSFRLSEWEQNISEKMQPLVIACGLPFAFILLDLTFLGVERTNIPSHGRRNCTPPASNLSSSDGKKRKF